MRAVEAALLCGQQPDIPTSNVVRARRGQELIAARLERELQLARGVTSRARGEVEYEHSLLISRAAEREQERSIFRQRAEPAEQLLATEQRTASQLHGEVVELKQGLESS